MKDDIFPITLRCNRERGQGAQDFMSLWHSIRPKGYSWYGYDVIIDSPTKVTFIIYGMDDACHGGVGDKQGEFYPLETPEIAKLTLPRIVDKCKVLAENRYLAELAARDATIVLGYQREILEANGFPAEAAYADD